MLAAGAATWRKASGHPRAPVAEVQSPSCPPLIVARDLAAGLIVGAMTGFFGVGGGFPIVPTLAVALAPSMRLAVGTSLVIITATSLMALIAHLVAGRALDVGLTAAMTAACIAGAVVGARLAGRVSQRRLGPGFAALVIVVASYLLVSVAVLGGPPGSS